MIPFEVTINGPQPELLKQLLGTEPFSNRSFSELTLRNTESRRSGSYETYTTCPTDWIQRFVGKVPYFTYQLEDARISWSDKTGTLMASGPDSFPSIDKMLRYFATLPFETASIRTRHEGWRPSMCVIPGTGHRDHSFALLFKGRGHDHFVSQRYIDRGVWRVIRRYGITMVQFHDVDADSETAYDQAWIGHRLLGWSVFSGGGLIWLSGHRYNTTIRGRYTPRGNKLFITTMSPEMEDLNLHDLCTFRYERRNHSEQPIDNIAVVFPDEATARHNLNPLWIHGLECYAIRPDGSQIRLDEHHTLTEDPEPDWVKAARDKDGL